MKTNIKAFLVVLGIICNALLSIATTPGEPNAEENIADTLVSYKRDVQPIWDKHCIRCHHPEFEEVSVSLTSEYSYYDLDYGKYFAPFRPEKSYVYKATKGERPDMPPEEDGLSEEELDLLYKWIVQGAKDN